MFTIRNYVKVASLDEAYKLLQKNKKNTILGGLLWLKMGSRMINTAIDLSELSLNEIVETNESFEIGAMVTLRDLECSEALNLEFGGLFKKTVEHIVGVQLRNRATVGGSIYSRFGFSDVLTSFLALDSYVELHNGGVISMEEFAKSGYDRDIIVKIIVKKNKAITGYLTHRLSETDIPVLALAVGKADGEWRISVGARPKKAKLALKTAKILSDKPTTSEIERACEVLIKELDFDSNMRASKEYRIILAKVLLKRVIAEIEGESYVN